MALYIGRRLSIDLDMFSVQPFDVQKMERHRDDQNKIFRHSWDKNGKKHQQENIKTENINRV